MKKLIASVLSLSLLCASVSNLSFAEDMKATFTIKHNNSSKELKKEADSEKDKSKAQELTQQEKDEIKLDNAANETVRLSYSDIAKVNPCMEEAVKTIQKTLAKPELINEKLIQLGAEKQSLLNYKETLLKNTEPNDENTKKQIKNIGNRLQAIEYTENYFKNYNAMKSNDFGWVIVSICLIFGLGALCWFSLVFH